MLDVINPADGSLLARVETDDRDAIAAKAAAARRAQPDWAQRPLSERKQALAAFRQRTIDERERLARLLSQEVGKPIAQSRNELAGLLPRIDFFIDAIDQVLAPQTVLDDASAGMREEIGHEPLGTVANVSAWNYPYFVGANVFVPALLAGNAVLYKPSEHALLTGAEIARLLHDSGVPPGVFQLVRGDGAAGAALLEQPLDGVFFTGSFSTGQRIAAAVAPRLTRLQLELGGKDPVYVCDDADVAAAAASLADGAMYNTGQSCCSVERIYVHRRVHDAFVAAFVAAVREFRIGDPLDESTYIGPLAREAQLGVLESQIEDAVSRGTRVECGGRRLPGPGHWFEPAVLTGVDHSMQIMRDESFGPVIGIQPVAADDEAIERMNDTRYGLTAGVYTPDPMRARRVLARVRSGSSYWNCCDRVSPRLPWTGWGDSGVGVTLSRYGIEAMTRLRAWHLRGGQAQT